MCVRASTGALCVYMSRRLTQNWLVTCSAEPDCCLFFFDGHPVHCRNAQTFWVNFLLCLLHDVREQLGGRQQVIVQRKQLNATQS